MPVLVLSTYRYHAVGDTHAILLSATHTYAEPAPSPVAGFFASAARSHIPVCRVEVGPYGAFPALPGYRIATDVEAAEGILKAPPKLSLDTPVGCELGFTV